LIGAVLIAAAGLLAWRAVNPPGVAEVARAFAEAEGIPGGVVAWGRAGAPPKVAAFGTADIASGRAMTPETRFMLASLSKPMTAALVIGLADQGKLALDATLGSLFPEAAPADPRFGRITIAELLRHSGGWDRGQSFDPVADYIAAQRELGLAPPDCGPITEAMLAHPLQSDPGARYAYSNLGYCWLGRAVERATGVGFEAAMSGWLTARIGPNGLRIGFGDTPSQGRALPYHVGPDGPTPVEWTERRLRVLGAAGGWTGTAADYLRAAALPVDPRQAARPAYAADAAHYYGFGWRVWPSEGGPVLTHFGTMPGVYTLVLRLPGGETAVALFNARPGDDWQALDWLMKKLSAALMRE
jgi:CubicO group peptidase (beta-lactamase class C family)